MNIFITGISSGIGYSLAEAYLSRGDTVYGISRRIPQHLTSQAHFHFKSIDLSDETHRAPLLQEFLAPAPHFDIVILNAGILGTIQEIISAPLSELKKVMDINMWANKTLLDILFSLPQYPSQVIALSSGAAVNGNKGWSGYSISKAAFAMLIKLYAAEFPESHFCSFAPGLVETAMQDIISSHDTTRFPTLARLQEARGTSSMPTPHEFAKKALELIPLLKELPTGSFQDIRKLNFS